MIFSSLKSIRNRIWQSFRICSLGSLALLIFNCNTTESSPVTTVPVTKGVITILAPATGRTFTLNSLDTVKIIAECDYSKFTSGLNIQYSLDSSKTWVLIESLVRKEGNQKDTLDWLPNEAIPGEIQPGRGVMLRVIDYGKKYFAISGYIFFKA
jgi:hypothetical protein